MSYPNPINQVSISFSPDISEHPYVWVHRGRDQVNFYKISSASSPERKARRLERALRLLWALHRSLYPALKELNHDPR